MVKRTFMEEIWINIPIFNGEYAASSLGRIKATEHYDKRGHLRKEKILSQQTGYFGLYKRVGLQYNKKSKNFFVHRLVYLAFKGTIPKGMQINHLNEDTFDNRPENLSLATPSENINYGTRNQRVSAKMTNGVKRSKQVQQSTLDGKPIKVWPSLAEIERELGFQKALISRVCRGDKWHHSAYGYIWKYVS